MILWALSNQDGHLVLATGNKSELAVGYSTLYGDSVGGFAPLKDVPEDAGVAAGPWRNAEAERRGETPPIPENSITKPPSAELRPGQLDQDSLPAVRGPRRDPRRLRRRRPGRGAAASRRASTRRSSTRSSAGRPRRVQAPPVRARAQDLQPGVRPGPAAADHQPLARAGLLSRPSDPCHERLHRRRPRPQPRRTAPAPQPAAGAAPVRRVRIQHLQAMKERGEKWAMLTAYDQYTAEIFDEAGIPVLLVGDSAGNNVFGYETTLPVTVDELLPAGAGGHPRGQARAGRRRPAVRLLPGQPGAGARHRGPVHEGGPGATRSSSRAARDGPRGRAAGPRRHPGDGAHRLHPAERARPRRLPGAGPRRRGADELVDDAHAARGRPARSPSSWRWCPATSPAQVTEELRDPDHRHRRRPGLRRPGAGLAGHGRPARRPGAAVRQAVRRPARRPSPRPRGRTPPRSPPASFPAAEHSFED